MMLNKILTVLGEYAINISISTVRWNNEARNSLIKKNLKLITTIALGCHESSYGPLNIIENRGKVINKHKVVQRSIGSRSVHRCEIKI